MSPTRTGTSHFTCTIAAVGYYRPQEGDQAEAYVAEAIQEQRIHIGPPICPSWAIILEDRQGRYILEDKQRRMGQRRKDTTTGPPAVAWFGAKSEAMPQGHRLEHPERRQAGDRRRRP